MEIPNDKETAEIAMACSNAAFDKAEQLGYPRIAGIVGIERAFEATKTMIVMHSVLGDEGMDALCGALEKAQVLDMMKEAEEALEKEE